MKIEVANRQKHTRVEMECTSVRVLLPNDEELTIKLFDDGIINLKSTSYMQIVPRASNSIDLEMGVNR